jgi:putative thiamine transport system substrate-binding protein
VSSPGPACGKIRTFFDPSPADTLKTITLPPFTRRSALNLLGGGLALAASSASRADAAWDATLKAARGQTVYFNAWAGAEPINAYIRWAGQQTLERFGVRLEHVKISDAADVVKRVRDEKAAGKTDGTVDLVWINGKNFLAMKREGLLYGPITPQLPNFALVDVQGKPTTRLDFAEPVDGMEAPWGMAQLTFLVDSKRTPKPPQSIHELLAFAKANPGRVTYPRPPDFHGSTLLKQMLLDLHTARDAFYLPVTPEVFAKTTAPLWAYLEALHPHLWRAGKQFANSAASMRQMLADGELRWALTFNPNDAANEIAAGRLQSSVVSYQFSSGTIGNTHFVAIPVNASAKPAALVVANFLLSAEAQARKADTSVWGDPTVLAFAKLSARDQSLFAGRLVPGQVHNAAPAIPEPHGSWVEPLEKEWLKRYGV